MSVKDYQSPKAVFIAASILAVAGFPVVASLHSVPFHTYSTPPTVVVVPLATVGAGAGVGAGAAGISIGARCLMRFLWKFTFLRSSRLRGIGPGSAASPAWNLA